MKFANSVSEVMKERISCRTFNGETVRKEERDKIEEILSAASCADFRFSYVEKSISPAGEKIGAYGTIRNAKEFIAAVVRKDSDLSEFGAVLETIVLYAEDMGLSTIWLGGTFNRAGFITKLIPSADEAVPVVIAVGYGADRPSLTDRLMRTFVGAAHRKKWEEIFFNGSFSIPLTESSAGVYAEVLEMTRIAPSAVNFQPWRVLRDENGFHFYLARRPGYKEKINFDIQTVDVGIAFSHFVLAAGEKGLKGRMGVCRPAVDTTFEYIRSWLV